MAKSAFVTRAVVALGIVVAFALQASGCKGSDTVVDPGARPTPAPTPVPLGGTWIGTFVSDHQLQCYPGSQGTATAELLDAGSGITGTVVVAGDTCRFTASIQATRQVSGELEGTATVVEPESPVPFTGAVTGRLDGSILRLDFATLSNGESIIIGGSAFLHRQ